MDAIPRVWGPLCYDFVELQSPLRALAGACQQVPRIRQSSQTASRCRRLITRFWPAAKTRVFAHSGVRSSALIDLEVHTQPAAASRRRARVREGRAGKDRHARGNRAAEPAHPVRPYLLRRSLCVGLLKLHVVGSDGTPPSRRLRGSRQHLRSRYRKRLLEESTRKAVASTLGRYVAFAA